MNRFATRTIALAAAATLAVMLAGIGVAVGSPDGDHARVAALSRAVKKLDNRFDEVKGELNDLHNDDESTRPGVSLAAPRADRSRTSSRWSRPGRSRKVGRSPSTRSAPATFR